MKNSGIKNEYLFIDRINNKTINELSFLLQEMILFLFPYIKNNSIIKCYKNVEYEKTDICIKVGSKIKYISIKMGHKNSVHCEIMKKFKQFLNKLNINKKVIEEILKYHYGDGTLDGSGKIRKSVSEYKLENKEMIELVNKEINNSKNLKKVVNRFIIQGTQWHTHKIDLLIYGTPDDFFFITSKDIYSYIEYNKNIESSAIHFSCLTFQPMSRVLDYNEKYEYMRNWIQIKWYNLEDSIIDIMNLKAMKLI